MYFLFFGGKIESLYFCLECCLFLCFVVAETIQGAVSLWVIELTEWSVADAGRPQTPSESPLWPSLSIASILSAPVSQVLMWAWGAKVTQLISVDVEARPPSWPSCDCFVNNSPCSTSNGAVFRSKQPMGGSIFMCLRFGGRYIPLSLFETHKQGNSEWNNTKSCEHMSCVLSDVPGCCDIPRKQEDYPTQ